jgi:N-acetylmuramoyl-L-alanine amidase
VTAVPAAAATGISGIWYAVQLLTSEKPLPAESSRFNGVRNIREDHIGSVYKYSYGKTASFQEAVDYQAQMRNQGFKDAFVVAYRDNDRITVQEARQAQANDNPK